MRKVEFLDLTLRRVDEIYFNIFEKRTKYVAAFVTCCLRETPTFLQVSRDLFRRVLSQFDLYLREDSALNMFLARCNLPERGDISYVDFLNKFQDRSESGIAHNILQNPQHR